MSTPLERVAKKKEAALKNLNDKGYNLPKKIFVGMATCEIAAGSKEVMEVFQEAMKKGLKDVYLSQKGCAGRCHLEPTVEVIEEGKIPVKYCKVDKERAKEILARHIIEGKAIKEWVVH
jgi:(2Fe-2S) ferredoxin